MITSIINLYGPPCAGKTTTAHALASKEHVLLCEEMATAIIGEFPTGGKLVRDNPMLVTSFQYEHMKERLAEADPDYKVLVCECPLELSAFYAVDRGWPFSVELLKKFNAPFEHLARTNIWLDLLPDYWSDAGRVHTLEEAYGIQDRMKEYLDSVGVKF